jgi:hypothetical protein
MNHHRSIGTAVKRVLLAFLLPLAALPGVCRADYASIAWSADGKSWGWALRESQALANRVALEGCNDGAAAQNDCRVTLHKAVARAQGKTRVGMSASKKGVDDARKSALAACGDPDCRIVEVITSPGFVAYARTKNGESDAHFYVTYAFSSSDEADKRAVAGCEKNAGEPCQLSWSGAIGGRMETAAPAARPVAPEPVAQGSCRPRSGSIRCSSQCVNGNCVITYENGCRLRVQVSPTFDAFSNSWKYPAPSC